MTDSDRPGDYQGPPPTPHAQPRQTYAEWQAENNPWASAGPAPGHYGSPYPPQGYYPTPAQQPKSVTGLGIATQVMLGIHLLTSIVLLFPALHERSLIKRILDDPTSVTLDEADDADRVLGALSVVSTLLYVATGIVFIIWFYRVRANAEVWGPHYQRRAQGWAIGAWFCPIVNFWFPLMMAQDALDATESDPASGYVHRRVHPVLAIWWFGFVAMLIAGLVVRGANDPKEIGDFSFYANAVVADVVITALAAIPAIFMVRRLAGAQAARLARGGAPAPTPWAA